MRFSEKIDKLRLRLTEIEKQKKGITIIDSKIIKKIPSKFKYDYELGVYNKKLYLFDNEYAYISNTIIESEDFSIKITDNNKGVRSFVKITLNENNVILEDKTKHKITIPKTNEMKVINFIKGFSSKQNIERTPELLTCFNIVDRNATKYELVGLYIDFKNQNIVSTDTKRLQVFNYKKLNSKIKKNCIIKYGGIEYAGKNNFTSIDIDLDLNISRFNLKDDSNLYVNNIVGEYPNYQRIIPNEYQHIDKINVKEWIYIIENSLGGESKINLNSDKIIFKDINDIYSYKAVYKKGYKGVSDYNICVNNEFLLDVLKGTQNKEIELCLNYENIPFTLKDKNFINIIMPLSC